MTVVNWSRLGPWWVHLRHPRVWPLVLTMMTCMGWERAALAPTGRRGNHSGRYGLVACCTVVPDVGGKMDVKPAELAKRHDN